MPQHRTDPIFGKMTLVHGEWRTTIQLNNRQIPLSVAQDHPPWETIYTLWQTIQQQLDDIQQDVAEVCHYDCSIEWGTDFPISEEQTLAFIQLESIHFSQQGCQLRYKNDFSPATWATSAMSEPTIITVDLNWNAEIENLNYVDDD